MSGISRASSRPSRAGRQQHGFSPQPLCAVYDRGRVSPVYCAPVLLSNGVLPPLFHHASPFVFAGALSSLPHSLYLPRDMPSLHHISQQPFLAHSVRDPKSSSPTHAIPEPALSTPSLPASPKRCTGTPLQFNLTPASKVSMHPPL